MAKKLNKLKQLPHIYRIFTAVKLYPIRAFLVAMLALTTTLLLFEIATLAYNYVRENQAREKEKGELLREKVLLQRVVKKYPDFRDGYYKLAEVEYRLDNIEGAKWYIQKALEIDPNFKPARELERLFGGL